MEEEEGQSGIRVGDFGGHTHIPECLGPSWHLVLFSEADPIPFVMNYRESLKLISMLTLLGSRTFHSQKSLNTKIQMHLQALAWT